MNRERTSQLELFTGEALATSAAVHVFPVARRHTQIKEIAAKLESKRGGHVTRYWESTCRRLYRGLIASGVSHEAAQAELNALALAVQAEIDGHPVSKEA